jgi:hypothetical protein
MTDQRRGPDATSDDRLLARIWEWSAPVVEPIDAAAIALSASTRAARRVRLVTGPRDRTVSLIALPVIALAVVAVLAVGALVMNTVPPTPSTLVGAASSDEPSPDASPGSARPTETPDPDHTLPPGRGIDWDAGAARLQADAFELRIGDQVFTGRAPADADSSYNDPFSSELDVSWSEHGVEMRLLIFFAADDDDWWVREIRTYDGRPVGEWISYAGPESLRDVTRTPRGETFELDLVTDGAEMEQLGPEPLNGFLTIDGMRLTAFVPGTGPAPLTGCTRVAEPDEFRTQELQGLEGVGYEGVDWSPLDEGQPLHGTGIEEMVPAQAEALLRELGLCYTFVYEFRILGDEDRSTGERWCTAPPGGTVDGISYRDGEILLWVQDEPREPRPQPPAGWNCPVN